MSTRPLPLLASRYRPAPSSPPRRAPVSTAPQSRVLAALTTMSISELDETRATLVKTYVLAFELPVYISSAFLRTQPPDVHPFFRAATAPAVEPRSAKAKSSLVRLSPPKEADAAATPKLPLVLPVYSYKSLSPAPKMRFTRSVADADKWVKQLDQTGCVAPLD